LELVLEHFLEEPGELRIALRDAAVEEGQEHELVLALGLVDRGIGEFRVVRFQKRDSLPEGGLHFVRVDLGKARRFFLRVLRERPGRKLDAGRRDREMAAVYIDG